MDAVQVAPVNWSRRNIERLRNKSLFGYAQTDGFDSVTAKCGVFRSEIITGYFKRAGSCTNKTSVLFNLGTRKNSFDPYFLCAGCRNYGHQEDKEQGQFVP